MVKKVLGIETSCDETGIAIYDDEHGLLANVVYSQIPLHAKYGGVVPELASRDHVQRILPLIDQSLAEAQLVGSDIDGVAFTTGPGLMGALLVGAAVGRSLAFAWGVPAIGVHHMEAHLLAPMLEDSSLKFPFLALLVSGGHTQLVSVSGHGAYELLGESVDDAAGEAFDKTAKLLGLSYPGGPSLAALATKGRAGKYVFPKPMTDRPGLDMSFSGLKTFALNTVNSHLTDEQSAADIALAFETAVVETLVIKCRRALRQTDLRRLVIAGGVGANTRLRTRLREMAEEEGASVHFPRAEYCTDNGAMVAFAGWCRLAAGEFESLGFQTRARWSLETLTPTAMLRSAF